MFDNYSLLLFNNLPSLPELDIDITRRLLSRAYLYSIKMQLGLVQDEFRTVDIEVSEEEMDRLEEEMLSESSKFFQEYYYGLRRLGDTLESSAIFDENEDEYSVKAAAFVGAESLSLLATILGQEDEKELLFSNEYIYTRIEAAMLFMISGYDANAQTEINDAVKALSNQGDYDVENNTYKIEYWCLHNLFALITNKLWEVDKRKPVLKHDSKKKTLKNLIEENKIQMYSLIGESIVSYVEWLVGEDNEGLNNGLSLLAKVNQTSHKNKYSLFPEIYHLSKVLMVMVNHSSKRALLHNTLKRENESKEFREYLKGRAKGDSLVNSRPFIWESAKEFIDKCLPGPSKHTIVNLPTGSGKSFIAELALTQSLSKGWILYLAPTNALVHQIKRDLRKSLRFYGDIPIRTFVGGDEYTKLDNEFLDERDNANKFVAVMTPEKCAMSLRINPEVFKYCSLCIFDECHLLGEGVRGASVDLVLGQILSISHDIKFVLMSAMLNNPNDLAAWLTKVTSDDSQISSILWKPTRSIRGAVGVEYSSYLETKEIAKVNLNSKPRHRKNEKFEPKLSILYSLSGVWQQDVNDYSLIKTNVNAKYTLSRRKYNDKWIYHSDADSWVNATSKSLGFELATKGIPTIVFIPTNRHYPFVLARNLNLKTTESDLGVYQQKLLMLAEKELGTNSEVKNLLASRIGVHSSYMLESEKEAVEQSFINKEVKLLFATGTLAQGLNLPSVAVVIAGTRVGDAREAHTIESQMRSKALILNAIGRAGRAGFSNQSFSIIVPNTPIAYKEDENDITRATSTIDVLSEQDASIVVKSPLENFLDNIINGTIQADRASLDELTIMSMLTADNEQDEAEKNKAIISRTYAAATMRHQMDEKELIAATMAITEIKKEFLEKANAPEWLVRVARKSGFDFFTTNLFIKIAEDVVPLSKKTEVVEWSIEEWKNILFKCMEKLPPHYIQNILPETATQKPTFINKMVKLIGGNPEKDLSWEPPSGWEECWEEFSNITWMYMDGKSYADIARIYLQVDGAIDSSRSAGKHIPDTIALVKKQIAKISTYAGLLLATIEEVFFENEPLPFNLNVLPLAIKNGLKDHSTFYWFNYGMRNRIVAHTLGATFPLEEFEDEETSIKEVQHLKRNWLYNESALLPFVANYDILEAAKMILKNS
ncbi:DEAD/DEAH box helicase [Halobacillus sp. MO56]